jgi:lysine-specific demethylase 8
LLKLNEIPGLKTAPLPRRIGEFCSLEQDSGKRTPFILSKAAIGWEISREARLPRLLERFGKTTIQALVDLPDNGATYHSMDAKHRVNMTLGELGERMARGLRCYGAQIDVRKFDGIQPSTDLDKVLPPSPRVVNLWIGSQTKSGLHHDPTDNLFVQVDGIKHAMIVSPEYSNKLYPFADNPTQSRVDPERPDFKAFPRLAQATFLTETLEPGDILYLPRGWWHFFAAPGPSVSLNCWFGLPMTPREQAQAVTAAMPLAWGRILIDFVLYGLLNRPYPRRLMGSAPAGKVLFHWASSQMPWRRPKPR